MNKNRLFSIECNTKWFGIGGIMIFISLLMPIYFKHENFRIYESITLALENWDKEYLVDAMFKLVVLNTLRSFPNYIAIFIIINSISLKYKEKDNLFLKLCISIAIIPIIYFFIKSCYNINLLLGKSSILGILWLYYYSRFKLKGITLLKKGLGLLLFVMGIQWLDVTNYFRVLGSGELTRDLRRSAELIGAENFINTLGVIFFLFFTIFSILLIGILKSQEKDMDLLEKELENRFYRETRYLVHDLKTPIFSIKTLIELLKIQEENEKKLSYYSRIENSLEKSEIIISEILKTNNKTLVKVSEIFEFIFPTISPYIKNLTFENYLHKDYEIRANRLLVARAIINLISNAYEASKDGVKVILKDYKHFFYIIIEDEGIGICEEKLKEIFQEGYSTKNSSGLGLSFVKTVMENHNFSLYFKRKKIKGTNVYIKLKGVNENE